MDELIAQSLIRDVPDFPKPGIVFKDLCPVIGSPAAFQEIIDRFSEWTQTRTPDVVIGVESRGFIFGAPIALSTSASFVPARKAGKLPGDVVQCEYGLEYGTACLELQKDAVPSGARVVIVDDVLATGGTASAVVKLVESLGARVVGVLFVVELGFLNGRDRLPGCEILSLIRY